MWCRERDEHRERERERERDECRETDIHTQREREGVGCIHTQREMWTDREKGAQRKREREKKEIERERRGRETRKARCVCVWGGGSGRERERERERDRQKERERDRQMKERSGCVSKASSCGEEERKALGHGVRMVLRNAVEGCTRSDVGRAALRRQLDMVVSCALLPTRQCQRDFPPDRGLCICP